MFAGSCLRSFSFVCAAAVIAAVSMVGSPTQAMEGCFRGINLSGAEFGEPPGTAGKDYVYPSNETIDYFASKGFTSVRLPFLWERLQPRLEAELDATELARLVDTVGRLRERGLRIVLDPHNYARYRGEPIGSAAVPVAAFADFWSRLARVFANQPDVSFGLMNEPHDISAGQWREGANAAIAGIREAGADNLVLVPGTAWTGAHSWQTSPSDGANADVMLGVVDPSDNYTYEVHQYFDSNFSGTSSICDRASDAVAAVEAFTRWLRDHGKRGYLGEFGVPADEACIGALADMVKVVEGNRDLWVGWAYWVAGDWWPPSEALNIQPTIEGDRPQLAGLAPALKDFSSSAAECPALDRP
ncbi:MAG: glycoside hydrolase family 5 protein [Rhizobiaceae bacterium]|nr:glycoside hydrolase family 5 protein [Rhizobiaceae bacterium]